MLKNVKKIFLFITLLLLLIGIVNASENITDTITTDSLSHDLTDTSTDNSITKEKIIEKHDTNINTKSVQKQTIVSLNDINDVEYSKYTQINGYYRDQENKNLRYTTMIIDVDGKKYYAKTNNEGYFSYNYKTNKTGINTVTVYYPGNSNYAGANATKTFTVNPKSTNVIIKSIYPTNIKYGDSATINGEYVDNESNGLRYTTMIIDVNGKKYYTKTDVFGYFEYNFIPKGGKNNVTVYYPGNTNYAGASTSKLITVTPKETYITLDWNYPCYYASNTTISGNYKDDEDNNLRYTTMIIDVDGKKYYAKTDAYGHFKLNYKSSYKETNNITVYYPGNNNYKSAKETTTIYFDNKPTEIILNPIPKVNKGDTVNIRGKYIDMEGNPLKFTNMRITIPQKGWWQTKFTNEQYKYLKTYYSRTDGEGNFNFSYTTTYEGTVEVRVEYPGTKYYDSAQNKVKFIVSRENTNVFLYPINTNASTLEIEGTYEDSDNKPLRYTTMTININGTKYYAKTDQDGYFKINYKANKTGTYEVNVSYSGNTRYIGGSDAKIFTIEDTNTYKTIELTMYPDEKEIVKTIDNYPFIARYSDYWSQVLVSYQNDEDNLPKIILTNGIFFLKDKKGNIISEPFDGGQTHHLYNYYNKNYTPYKVSVSYREMTKLELKYAEKGYEYQRRGNEISWCIIMGE